MPNTNPEQPKNNPTDQADKPTLEQKHAELKDALKFIDIRGYAYMDQSDAKGWENAINTSVNSINDSLLSNRQEAYGKIEALLEQIKPLQEYMAERAQTMINNRNRMQLERHYDDKVNTYSIIVPYTGYNRCRQPTYVPPRVGRGASMQIVEWTPKGPKFEIKLHNPETVVKFSALNRDGKWETVDLTAGSDFKLSELKDAPVEVVNEKSLASISKHLDDWRYTFITPEADGADGKDGTRAYEAMNAEIKQLLANSKNPEEVTKRLQEMAAKAGVVYAPKWRDDVSFVYEKEAILAKHTPIVPQMSVEGDFVVEHTPQQTEVMLANVKKYLENWRQAYMTREEDGADGKDGTRAYVSMNAEVKRLLEDTKNHDQNIAKLQQIASDAGVVYAPKWEEDVSFVFKPESSAIQSIHSQHVLTAEEEMGVDQQPVAREYSPDEKKAMLANIKTSLENWRHTFTTAEMDGADGKDGTRAYEAMNADVRQLLLDSTHREEISKELQKIATDAGIVTTPDLNWDYKFEFKPDGWKIHYVKTHHELTPSEMDLVEASKNAEAIAAEKVAAEQAAKAAAEAEAEEREARTYDIITRNMTPDQKARYDADQFSINNG